MSTYIPDVGETFDVTSPWGTHSYRVTCWLKRRPPRGPYTGTDEQTRITHEIITELIAEGRIDPPRGAGPDNVPLVFCTRDEAEYVSGYGVAGTIQRVSDVVITGRVSWAEDVIADERDLANMFAGRNLD